MGKEIAYRRGAGLYALAASPQLVRLPLRWLPSVASSLVPHLRFGFGRLPLPSLARGLLAVERDIVHEQIIRSGRGGA
jgi:hypothetical protein